MHGNHLLSSLLRSPSDEIFCNILNHSPSRAENTCWIDSGALPLLPVNQASSCNGMAIDPQELRRVMGHFATGVTVITTKDKEGVPNGLTANAFLSLSLNPPLVLISVGKSAQCYTCFERLNPFTVNFLSEHQEELSQRFATKGIDKFAGIEWHEGRNGAAILDGALGYVECKITQCFDGGDHTIVVGEILHAHAAGERPLLFFKGKYQRLPT
jgi:flavin reductase (DIM6/NTAB) family NADH-FMN oxidoreductase RutF